MRLQCTVFCLVCVIFVVSAVEHGGSKPKSGWRTNISDAWKKVFSSKTNNRQFSTGLGANLVFTTGDTIVGSVYGPKTLTRPYKWFYAVSHAKVIVFKPPGPRFLVASTTKPKIITVNTELKTTKLMNRKKKAGHIGKIGVLIAALMANSAEKLHFSFRSCNGKHYVEYLTLGKANKGKWYSVMYGSMNQKCPLQAELTGTDEMLRQVYLTKRFQLKNGLKETIDLKIDKWPDYVTDLNLYGSSD